MLLLQKFRGWDSRVEVVTLVHVQVHEGGLVALVNFGQLVEIWPGFKYSMM